MLAKVVLVRIRTRGTLWTTNVAKTATQLLVLSFFVCLFVFFLLELRLRSHDTGKNLKTAFSL